MAMQEMSPVEQAKLQMMQDLEIEMMSDLYNRMTQACHKKCIPPKYSDSELGKGEMVCIDRCGRFSSLVCLSVFAHLLEPLCLYA